jgi:hypothetical protein
MRAPVWLVPGRFLLKADRRVDQPCISLRPMDCEYESSPDCRWGPVDWSVVYCQLASLGRVRSDWNRCAGNVVRQGGPEVLPRGMASRRRRRAEAGRFARRSRIHAVLNNIIQSGFLVTTERPDAIFGKRVFRRHECHGADLQYYSEP